MANDILGYVNELQAKLRAKKVDLKSQKKKLVSSLKDGFHYRLSFSDPEQVVDFIEFCKTVKGRFEMTGLDNKSVNSFSDQLFFTDTEVGDEEEKEVNSSSSCQISGED